MEYETIEFKEKYTDINEVLYWLVEQAKVGVPYCVEKFPQFKDPAEMYYYFSNRVQFHADPPATELIQSPGTLFEDNYFGIPGAGDCDCFVCLLLACGWANNWQECYIVLYGRSKKWPSHISLMIMHDGRECYMDLTESGFNTERHYPLKQLIPVFK